MAGDAAPNLIQAVQDPPTMEHLSLASQNPGSTSNGLTLEERFRTIRSVGEECIQEDELMGLLAAKEEPICYDGFEPSGRMHIAQVRRFTSLPLIKFMGFTGPRALGKNVTKMLFSVDSSYMRPPRPEGGIQSLL